DGVLYGGMGTSTAESSGWKSGKYGTALSFDGVDDYVNVPDTTGSVLDITSAITISAWVNLTDVTGDARQIVAKDTTGEGSGAPYHLNINQTTGLFKGRIGNGVTNQDITGTTNVANGKWHFVVFSYDANSLYIYVDGVLEKTSVKTITPTTNNTALMIGSWNNIWSKFLGLIDDVRIYNYARTQEQILQDYNQGKAIQFR
ncbi:MAG: LamG domain-containing protein, partial [Candidatus Nealsonbacteria bacterium]|nr:LamG domain-containing protein [Candidatus Nealsonbacteria bacterium]